MEFLPTDFLRDSEIMLVLDHTFETDPSRGFVPGYELKVCDLSGATMGRIALRVGFTEDTYYCGNIGYRIDADFRGHHYAEKACRLVFRLAKMHGMDHVIITCVPDNEASRRTCERLGGQLMEIATVPEDNDMRINKGTTNVCIYKIFLQD